MSFFGAFLHSLPRRPVLALAALYWHLTGRRQRARNRLRMAAPQGAGAYRLWIDTVEQQDQQITAAKADMASWDDFPRISVIFYDEPSISARQHDRVLAAFSAQCYDEWELVVVQSYEQAPARPINVPRMMLAPSRAGNAAQALLLGTQTASCDYILPLPAGTLLPPTALYHYARAIRQNRGATVLYGDHDQIDSRGHRQLPWFKPRWNAELFLGQDYLSPACIIATQAARPFLPVNPAVGQVASYALLQAVTAALPSTDQAAAIVHVPHILAHCPATPPPAKFSHSDQAHSDQAARAAVVARQLAPVGAVIGYGPHGTVRVDWPLPTPLPLVTIIIPTRDGVGLLKNCMAGVLGGTRYRHIEVLIVDNGSRQPETLEYLGRIAQNPRVRVLRHDAPFNFSTLNNLAVAQARGSYLCLLNNDVELTDENWLTALMRQAVRPHIGAAGAQLLYDDGTLQHAGVTIGLGQAAGHAHRFIPANAPGYFARHHLAHYVSAVTAACLVVSREKYLAVGGLDEANFAVAFNDVDFCLKLEAAGWRNIYVPQAVAIHHESKTRGRDTNPDQRVRYHGELACLQNRWHTRSYADPLHHPALDRNHEHYLLRLIPEPGAEPNTAD